MIAYMVNYDKKIHSREPDPYENIRIPPTDKDKKKRDEHDKESGPSKIFATLASYFKKIASLFAPREQETPSAHHHPLIHHLAAFRAQLQTLAKHDESHELSFTQRLTELWHKLSEECNSIWATQEFSSGVKSALKFLISQISGYPLGADHTLGFYFDASAGKEWTPFPFMQLLQDLHEEYQDEPQQSHLAAWISLIDAIFRMH